MSKCYLDTERTQRVHINHLLKPLYLCARYHELNSNLRRGATVTEPTEVYSRWLKFVRHLKATHVTLPKVYFVSLDIRSCFDTLPQKQLLENIPLIFECENYVIHNFIKVKVNQNKIVTRKFLRLATDAFDCDNFVDFVRKNIKKGTLLAKNVIYVDKVFTQDVTKNDLKNLLQKHIQCSIGRLGYKYVQQEEGR